MIIEFPQVANLLPAADRAATEAAGRVAPIWPRSGAVATTPLPGIAGQNLPAGAQTVAQMLGARLTMPRAYYATLLESGRIVDEDIAEAIADLRGELGVTVSVDRIRAEALQADIPVERFELPTAATLADRRTGTGWPELIMGSISSWAAGYFSGGTAVWSAAPPDAAPWSSFRAVAGIDRSPELMGLKHARRLFARMPSQPVDVLALLAARLRLPEQGLTSYFHRLLADVAGWVGCASYLGWRAEVRGVEGSAERQLLAIRAAWELALLESVWGRGTESVEDALREAYSEADSVLRRDLFATDQVLQLASERAAQRRLAAALETTGFPEQQSDRPDIQVAFCIDAHSELFRRALECELPNSETLGFAGFSGLPRVQRDAANRPTRPGMSLQARRPAGFDIVEALGLGPLRTLTRAALGTLGADSDDRQHPLTPVSPSLPEKIRLAERILRGMSLTEGFARLVVFAGHAWATNDFLFARPADCDACEGRAAEANARLAAQLLNDRFVRAGLLQHGIDIPADTVFAAARGDARDEIARRIEPECLTEEHRGLIRELQAGITAATARVRLESKTTPDTVSRLCTGRPTARSRVSTGRRITGSHVFIVAPGERSRDLQLDGFSFRHEYRHQRDDRCSVLETILTGPLVAAGWRTLEHYAATVDTRHFGSCDRTLLELLRGKGGLADVDSGLPRDGYGRGLNDTREVTGSPLRLTALIEAPQHAIDRIIEKHTNLALLVDNGWIQMHAIDGQRRLWRRQRGGGNWSRVETGSAVTSKENEAA